MRLLSFNVPTLDFDIGLHGDSHLGSRAYCTEGIRSFLSWVTRRPNRYYVHMGDAIEAIRVDDKRFNPENESAEESIAGRQRDSVIKTYLPSSKRCLAWLMGNHESAHTHSFNPAMDIAAGLNVPYGGYTCKLAIKYKGRLLLKLYLWHGPRMSLVTSRAKDFTQRNANMCASVRRHLEAKACDCLIMAFGHVHKLLVVPPAERLLISDDGSELRQGYLRQGDGSSRYIEPDARWYATTGSYRMTQLLDADDYSEVHGYDPVELGHAVVSVRGGIVQSVKRKVFMGGNK